jgi:hypothetical protein
MWEKVKSDRRVQFAVGLAVVLVAAKWLFTGNLFYAAIDMTTAPSEGQTKAGLTLSAIMPIVVDVVVGVLVAIGTYVFNIGEYLFGRVQNARSPSPDTSHASESAPADSSTDMRAAVIALGDAAAMNDIESLERLRVRIRKPYALFELQQAYEKNDLDTVGELVVELNKMHGATAVAKTASKKGGQQSNG